MAAGARVAAWSPCRRLFLGTQITLLIIKYLILVPKNQSDFIKHISRGRSATCVFGDVGKMGYIRYMSNSTTRFSDRVGDYVKYRPHYPETVIEYLRATYSITPHWTIADIGSGTGISSELFLRNGNRVYGVEPNRDMREKAEELLSGGYDGRFISIDGAAEAT